MSELQRTMRLGLLLDGDRSATSDDHTSFKRQTHWVKVCEEAKLDFVLLGGVAAIAPQMAGNPAQNPTKLEPLTLAAALAAVTHRIGLVPTASTSLHHPFALARRLASIDHLSQGRAGWHLVTNPTQEEQDNHSLHGDLDIASRHERAREFLAVVQGLFEGWEPDTFLRDRTTGIYMDPAKMHRLNHTGRYFKVRGPSDVDRPPQGALPIICEVSSDDDRNFAAEIADVVFGGQADIEDARASYSSIKTRLAHYDRTPESLRVMPSIMPMIGRTQTEAEDLRATLQYRSQTDTANGNNGYAKPEDYLIIGTPATIVDTMEEWFLTSAADGFIIRLPPLPDAIKDFAHTVVPELQRRGLFRTEYEGASLRAILGMTPVAV